MSSRVFKKNIFSSLRAVILPALFTLLVIAMVLVGLNQAERSSRAEGLRILEESIRRAAVRCYAIEGSYPGSIEYIEEHYGVHIDRTKYVVHYDVFASNITPDIMVIELKG